MLAMIFLTTSCQNFKADRDIPKVTWTQIDAFHNKANPNKVTKYDDKECKMVTAREPSFDVILTKEDGNKIINPKLHGGFWISYDDLNSLIGCAKEQCLKALEQQFKEAQNARIKEPR